MNSDPFDSSSDYDVNCHPMRSVVSVFGFSLYVCCSVKHRHGTTNIQGEPKHWNYRSHRMAVYVIVRWAVKRIRILETVAKSLMIFNRYYDLEFSSMPVFAPPLELHLTTSELWFGQEQEGILP